MDSKKKIVSTAGAYMACVIGSGFATGQEIMQFFSAYGYLGILGSFISMVLFSYYGAEVLTKAREEKFKDPKEIYTYYLGDRFGKILQYVGPVFLFGVFVIMIAGTGETFSEYYGLNPMVGRIFMAVLSFVVVSMGLEKLTNILGNIGPAIIIFTLTIAGICLYRNFDQLSTGIAFIETLNMKKASSSPLLSGVLYTTFNVIVSIVFLSGIGSSTKISKKESIASGVLGGVGLMAAGLILNLAIIVNIPALYDKNIPSLFLAQSIHPILATGFSVILLGGIFTTAVPLLWQVTNLFVADEHPKFKLITGLVTLAALICGMFPFDELVNRIYPLTGYVGIVIIVVMLYKTVKIHLPVGYKKQETAPEQA